MNVWPKIYFIIKVFFFNLIMQILLACSSINSERIAPSISGAYDSIKGALFGYADPIITKELINNIPYASALLKVGKGSSGLIILESINSNSSTWVSKDNVFIMTKYGRIVQTEGLFNNLTNLTLPDQSFEELLNNPKATKDYLSYYSYDQPYLLDLQVQISVVNRGIQEIEMLGEIKSLVLIEENISNEEIRWYAKNLFWVDQKDYFVWKSVQHISPKLPSFTLQITKRPSI